MSDAPDIRWTVPEGAEESFVVREVVKKRNLMRAQEIHRENRRLRELAAAHGIDPDGDAPLRREEAA